MIRSAGLGIGLLLITIIVTKLVERKNKEQVNNNVEEWIGERLVRD